LSIIQHEILKNINFVKIPAYKSKDYSNLYEHKLNISLYILDLLLFKIIKLAE